MVFEGMFQRMMFLLFNKSDVSIALYQKSEPSEL